MSQTQALLSKIAALRQRLEQAQVLVEDAGTTAAQIEQKSDGAASVRALQRKVALGNRLEEVLDGSLRHLSSAAPPPEGSPTQLTARARRLLPRIQELILRLRSFADGPLAGRPESDPLVALHRETTLLADLALRTFQSFAETPSLQLRQCEGVEALLKTVGWRADTLAAAIDDWRRHETRITELAGLLSDVAGLRTPNLRALHALAAELLHEAGQALPLRFLHASPSDLPRFIACHSLTVAQVIARVVQHDPDWRGQAQQPIEAALLHDVGMLGVSPDILMQTGPVDESQRRSLEAHAAAGAALLNRLGPDAAWLAEAALSHHERIDGTGYPAGMSLLQIGPLARLLAVCDVYAALCCPRPHRKALEPRTALTDTLTLSQQGVLDPNCARELLTLSLYPVGAAVELADGAAGIVVATPPGRKDLNACGRPVVALLYDGQGRALPFPVHVDLAACEGRSIVRSLPAAERCQLFGERYPECA